MRKIDTVATAIITTMCILTAVLVVCFVLLIKTSLNNSKEIKAMNEKYGSEICKRIEDVRFMQKYEELSEKTIESFKAVVDNEIEIAKDSVLVFYDVKHTHTNYMLVSNGKSVVYIPNTYSTTESAYFKMPKTLFQN